MEHGEGDFKATIKESILILLYEFIGTTFLTLLFLCSQVTSLNTHSHILDIVNCAGR